MNEPVRLATDEDLPAIRSIYNQAILAGGMTADVAPVSLEERATWLHRHDEASRPVWVALREEKVVGYASLSDYREGRAAVRTTAEVSFFVDLSERRRGIGNQLLAHAIAAAPSLGIEQLIAIVLAGNEPSRGLLLRHGFELWGRFPRVARIADVPTDHLYFGRLV